MNILIDIVNALKILNNKKNYEVKQIVIEN